MSEAGLGIYEQEIMMIVLLIVGIVISIVAVIVFGMVFVKLSRELCVRRLEYHRYFTDRGVYEGQETELVEEFTNHSFLPMFMVDVETHITSKIKMQGCRSDDEISQWFISRFFIMPYTKIRRVHKAACIQRGYFKLETAKITFAGIEVYLDSRADMYVYPRELSFEQKNILNHYMQYSAVSKRPLIEDMFSFAGIREYMTGDAMNAVNYKQTAKRGALMVNSREYMLGRKILLYVNLQPNEEKHMTGGQMKVFLEKELSMASYLLSQCAREGYSYALSINAKMPDGEDFVRNSFSMGERKLEENLCQLAQTGGIYGISMAALIDKDIQEYVSGAEVFLFTAYVDEALRRRADELEKLGNAVNIIDVMETGNLTPFYAEGQGLG